MKKCLFLFVTVATVLLSSCGPKVPKQYGQTDRTPKIYPDYVDVTVPVNIAPLTFMLDEPADEVVARFSASGVEVVCGNHKILPEHNEWRQLVDAAVDKAIQVEVYAKNGGQWTRFKPFSIHVSSDSIDPYISYRLISPSYVTYEELTINQRCLENYDESVVYDNMLCGTEESGQCINCHNYQMYNPQRMQFHARQFHGGTVIAYDGTLSKVNMKNDSILSAGVYPAWHPWLQFIVYSTNKTHQSFHVNDLNKIEVFDSESDLIAYDVQRNEVTNIENDPDEFECYPAWSPDGKWLYYCSAHFVHEVPDSLGEKERNTEVISRAYDVKYNLYRKSFNPATMAFGPRELVFDAAAVDKSATLPRISPDGRYLLFTMAQYGVFHIWHRDADLHMIDLQTGEQHDVRRLNSDKTESYHSWSSNGRWVIFSSRRDDGQYTRPFIAHFDKSGHCGKPFELPQADPAYHRLFMKCYNIPEFMKGPVTVRPQQFARLLKTDGLPPVSYKQHLSPQKASGR